MLQNDDLTARRGNAPSAAAQFIDTNKAARLLKLTPERVRSLARAGRLHGALVEISRRQRFDNQDKKPHPWLRAEALRRAQLSKWTVLPIVRERNTKPRAPKTTQLKTTGRLRWQFTHDDVLSFKSQRACSKHFAEHRKQSVRIFGRSARRIRLTKVRFRRLSRLRSARQKALHSPRYDPVVSINTKLLAWAPPSQK